MSEQRVTRNRAAKAVAQKFKSSMPNDAVGSDDLPSTSQQDVSRTTKNDDKTVTEDAKTTDQTPKKTHDTATTDSTPEKSPSSPEATCSICLSKPENKSFTDSCFHQFCFVCLVEWSKVKAVCPLCKQSFKSIIHNVRSMEDYDRYHIRSRDEEAAQARMHRFRYATTMIPGRSWAAHQRRLQYEEEQRQLQRPTRSTARTLYREGRQAATSNFRKRIYERSMRVEESRAPSEHRLRYRDVTPRFFAANPACAHRLVPWLNRELNVLLRSDENRVQFTLELILDLIKRYDIKSPEFKQHLSSVLNRRTDHFIHEFFSFARSPYDMIAYDAHAVYTEQLGPSVTDLSSDSDREDLLAHARGYHEAIMRHLPVNPIVLDHAPIVLDSDDEEYHRPSASRWGPPARPRRPWQPASSTQTQLAVAAGRSPSLAGVGQSPSAGHNDDSTRGTAGSSNDSLIIALRSPARTSSTPPARTSSTSPARTSTANSSVTVLYNSMFNADAGPSASGWESPILLGSSNWVPDRDLLRSIFGHSPGPSTSTATQHGSVPDQQSVYIDVDASGAESVEALVSVSSRSSDIEVTGFDKPWTDRSPIPLSSGNDTDDNMAPIVVVGSSRATSARKSSKTQQRDERSERSMDSEHRRARKSKRSRRSRDRHGRKRKHRDVTSSSCEQRTYDSRRQHKHKHKMSRRHRSRSTSVDDGKRDNTSTTTFSPSRRPSSQRRRQEAVTIMSSDSDSGLQTSEYFQKIRERERRKRYMSLSSVQRWLHDVSTDRYDRRELSGQRKRARHRSRSCDRRRSRSRSFDRRQSKSKSSDRRDSRSRSCTRHKRKKHRKVRSSDRSDNSYMKASSKSRHKARSRHHRSSSKLSAAESRAPEETATTSIHDGSSERREVINLTDFPATSSPSAQPRESRQHVKHTSSVVKHSQTRTHLTDSECDMTSLNTDRLAATTRRRSKSVDLTRRRRLLSNESNSPAPAASQLLRSASVEHQGTAGDTAAPSREHSQGGADVTKRTKSRKFQKYNTISSRDKSEALRLGENSMQDTRSKRTSRSEERTRASLSETSSESSRHTANCETADSVADKSKSLHSVSRDRTSETTRNDNVDSTTLQSDCRKERGLKSFKKHPTGHKKAVKSMVHKVS